MSKTYTLFVEGQDAVDYGTKKTAVKYGDESGKTYQVHSPSGAVVHAVQVDSEVADSGEPEVEDLIGDTPAAESEAVFYESIDFPGNYSIVLAPSAVALAEAAGVAVKAETFPGKLVRRVHFGGDDMDKAKAVRDLVSETYNESLEVLHGWQKANIEKRRGLTDMEKFLQHRDVIAKHFAKVTRNVKKNGL